MCVLVRVHVCGFLGKRSGIFKPPHTYSGNGAGSVFPGAVMREERVLLCVCMYCVIVITYLCIYNRDLLPSLDA